METSVKLQEPFSYSIWPIVITGAVCLSFLIFFLAMWLLKKKKKVKIKKPVVVMPVIDINQIKQKYMDELNTIENDVLSDKITIKAAYQKLSQCIRGFVFEATGIKVQNYTLMEIRSLRMPALEELVSEFYTPEFVRGTGRSLEDVRFSIEKTKRVIWIWN